MNDRLSFAFHFPNQPISIGIPACEEDLKEQHYSWPDRRRATKPRQNEFPDHGLDLKEKEGWKKDAGREEEHYYSLLKSLLQYPTDRAIEAVQSRNQVSQLWTIWIHND